MMQQLLQRGNNPGILQRYKNDVSIKLRILDTNGTQYLKKKLHYIYNYHYLVLSQLLFFRFKVLVLFQKMRNVLKRVKKQIENKIFDLSLQNLRYFSGKKMLTFDVLLDFFLPTFQMILSIFFRRQKNGNKTRNFLLDFIFSLNILKHAKILFYSPLSLNPHPFTPSHLQDHSFWSLQEGGQRVVGDLHVVLQDHMQTPDLHGVGFEVLSNRSQLWY